MSSMAARDGYSLKRRWEQLVEKMRREYLNPAHSWPWVLKFSAGKDSTLLAQAALAALVLVPAEQRGRPVWLVNNDTMVENPIMAEYARRQIAKIQAWATAEGLPVHCEITQPEVSDSFWVCMIGLGYPTPWHNFRWCTSRLKIRPSERFITERVAASGKVLVLLGVRADESASRRRSVERNAITDEARLLPDPKQAGCLVWQPIEDFETEEVWLCLYQFSPPWGGTNRELKTLYAAAAGSEACQIVMFQSQADDCGKGGRFGCWTCTVVEKDRSLQAMAEEDERLYPFLAFREYMISIRNRPGARFTMRRVWRLDFDHLGHVRDSGPFTFEARAEILAKLLVLERQTGMELLSAQEAWAIANQWEADGIDAGYMDFYEEALARLHRERQQKDASAFHLVMTNRERDEP